MVLAFCFLAILTGYLAGSLPTAWIVGKLWGIDILSSGSGNMGATNINRLIGWKPALIVLIVDIGKGAIAALIWLLAFPQLLVMALLASFAAILGHMYSLPLKLLAGRLQGGRGVATSLGAFCILMPWAITLVVLVAFLLLFAITRLQVLSALSVAFVALVIILVLYLTHRSPPEDLYYIVVVFCLLSFNLRLHVRRELLRGKSRAGSSVSPTESAKKQSDAEVELE